MTLPPPVLRPSVAARKVNTSPWRSERRTGRHPAAGAKGRQVGRGRGAVARLGLEAVDLAGAAEQSGETKTADVHADVDDDVAGGKPLRQAIFVGDDDFLEDPFIKGARA